MKFDLAGPIEDLYKAFDEARRPKAPEDLDICPCCVSEDDIQLLLWTELRSLTNRELTTYLYTATGPVSSEDYLYFFPRLADELFVGGWGVEWARLFYRLGNLEPQSWTQRQRSGLIKFMSSLLEVINRLVEDCEGNYDWALEEMLYCHAISGLPMTPVLDDLLTYPTLLATFYKQNPGIETTGLLSYSFVTPMPDEARAEIVEWMKSDRFLAILTEPDTQAP